jgi:ParB-like chromosome segregation protein Spo0J
VNGDTRARTRPRKAANDCTIREPLPEYCMEIVGNDAKQARQIRSKLRKGIQAAADLCKITPPVCVDNLGLTRDLMPQITGDANVLELAQGDKEDRQKAAAIVAARGRAKDTRTIQDQLLDYLEEHGVRTKRKRVPVGTLKATQSQIQASKAYGMADSHLRGDFPTIDKQIVISADGYILDGHHRWAALLTIDPGRYMSVLEVGLPMAKGNGPTLLGEAAAFPGVYQAPMEGPPLPAAAQKRYKKANRSKLGPKKRAAKRKTGPKRKPLSPTQRRQALSRAVREL